MLIQKIFGQISAVALPNAMNTLISYKIAHYDRSVDPVRPEYNEHCIFVFWHEYIGLILPRWGQCPLSILVSKHRDAEWVNQTALALGIHIVRGSTTRGGSSAIRQLKRQGKFSSLGFTPDGPRGPRRQMALGPVYLASVLQMPIVPVGVGCSHLWRLSTWDRFAVPKPLARARVIFGPKIYLKPKMKRDALETSRAKIQNLLTDISDHAESWAESGENMLGEQRFLRARRNNRLFFDKKPQKPGVPPTTKATTETKSVSNELPIIKDSAAA